MDLGKRIHLDLLNVKLSDRIEESVSKFINTAPTLNMCMTLMTLNGMLRAAIMRKSHYGAG
jgi:hypothetical protein